VAHASKAVAALTFALLALAALPAPALAVGTTIQLSVTPPNVTGKPSLGASGLANFSGFVELFSNPIGPVTIAVEMDSSLGWSVTPPSFSWRTSAPERFEFEFTVEVPKNASAELTDTVTITATARTGGITTATETASVFVTAGPYYAAEARRLTAPIVMEVGKRYVIEYDLKNTGNARASFTYAWADEAVNDKVRAEMLLPQGAALAGFANETIQFFVTPGPTTPGGKFQVPVRIELRDRQGFVQAVVNLSIEMEFTNLPIYQGFLPNWNMQGPYTLFGYAMIFLGIWFAFQVLRAAGRVRAARRGRAPRGRSSAGAPVDVRGSVKGDPAYGPGFLLALTTGLRRSYLVRGAQALLGKVRRRARAPPKRPDEIRGRALAAGRPPR